jgi:alkylation response protein AidB-like acyl-CoA dehydrogenase
VLTPNDADMLVELVASFAANEIAPRVNDYDVAETLPQDLLDKMGPLGFFGGVLSPDYGGLGLDFVTYTRVVEEISRVCNAMGCLISMPSGLVGAGIERFGTEAQKQAWLAPLARGQYFGAAGVTEPRSGSDVAGMATSYVRDGDRYVISGAKAWITNINIADFFLTFATRDRTLRHRGITAFIIPRQTPGVSVAPYKNKLGFRPLCTGDLVLDEVTVGPEAVLGEEGGGFAVAMTAVERGRLGVAARAVGVAQACLTEARSFATMREAFGQEIANFQIVQSKITDMAVGVETARLLVRAAAEALQRGERGRKLTSMAKMYASDVAFRSAADAVQIHGAAGISAEYQVARLLRDAKVLQIVEGSNDLHRALIAEMELGLRREDVSVPAARTADSTRQGAPS